jgi:hypothetical protein
MAKPNNNITKAQKEWQCNGNRMLSMIFATSILQAPRFPSSDPVIDPVSQFSQSCIITSLGYINSGFVMQDGTIISESPTYNLLTVYNDLILTVINNTKSYEVIDTRDNVKYSIMSADNIDIQNKFVTMKLQKVGFADRVYNQ